jgi:ubiquinone/menaquinone biosynthesis C-methylase UbiE
MDQKKVWNSIAPEWHEFKTKPAHHVIEFLKKQKGKILDLGSGSGRHLQKIKNGQMYLVDFSKKMVELAKEKSKKEKIPAEFFVEESNKLSFENNFFDSAICISALHCIESKTQREQSIKELHRVLKPKSKALIGVWNKKSKRFKNAQKEKFVNWRDKGKRFYYLYDEKEIHDLFKKNKFKILESLNSEMMINFIVEKN